MRHVEIAISSSNREDIERRLTGRFYTPIPIAERLALNIGSKLNQITSVGDPFCGDGRLVLAWLKIINRQSSYILHSLRRIVLWDYDDDAVRLARSQIEAELTRIGLKECKVEGLSCDTFLNANNSLGSLDLVLTNPPWELLKPDTRDGLDSSDGLYKNHLKDYAEKLALSFPGAMSAKGKAISGYGVNLARAGAIASIMMAKINGCIGIVLPSNIFADQASSPFRSEFFRRMSVTKVEFYPAEARLFEGVDQPFVTVNGRVAGTTKEFTLRRFDKHLEQIDSRIVALNDPSRPLALTVSEEHERIVRNLSKTHPQLNTLEADPKYGLWLGRELDETRLSDYFTVSPLGVPFLKGKHVFPYQIVREEISLIDPKKRQVPSSVQYRRLAWRDVSRPSQRRRMHVALVPEGNVTGNSLGVAYFRTGPTSAIEILLAILNSLVFEIQVRTNLSTSHISQGVLRNCAIPINAFEDDNIRQRIHSLVHKRLASPVDLPMLDVEIAKAYGLDKTDFATVLEGFPKITPEERQDFLRSDLWP